MSPLTYFCPKIINADRWSFVHIVSFRFQAYDVTGIESYSTVYEVSESYRIELSIWDTSGELSALFSCKVRVVLPEGRQGR